MADYANEHDVEAAIVSYDQAKAFDRVSHESYLFHVLRAFEFSKNFVSWVCLLYNEHVEHAIAFVLYMQWLVTVHNLVDRWD